MKKWSCRCKWLHGVFHIDIFLKEENDNSDAIEEIDATLDRLMHKKSSGRWHAERDPTCPIDWYGNTFWNFQYNKKRRISLGLYLHESADQRKAIAEMKKKMLEYLYCDCSNQW